ncbi:organic cation transporter protein-like [Lingula anatina]|uniref:Organic cation transporter protein-like n=1 Tax=Lingula anatina TaxID=7574 RepID=A0A1S3H616_LINAN|nr:organic cation transporter protein-like [Lingula anatina]|eukprot:XP_013381565.1 organic cation transporter protein-like [Lingula anatina]
MIEDEPDNVDFGDGVKDFDDILVLIGEFGKFQKLVFLLLSIASILPAMDYAAVVFIEETPDFRCRLPGDLNDSYSPGMALYLNTSDHVTSNATAQCTQLDVVINHQGNVSQDGTHPSKCTEWVFDTSVVKHSYPMQFKLVCDNSWMLTFSYIMYVSGTLIGGLAFGLLSDWAGRRFSLLLALGLSGFFGLGWVFSPTYPCSIAIRFMYGMFTSEIFTLSTTLALELVGPHKRMIAGTAVGIVSTAGGVVVTGIAYFLRDWRHLQLSISAPYLVFAATLFWLLPESPRWLLTKGRHEEAEKILRRAAKMNGKEFPKGLLTKVEINELPSTSIRALLHAPKLMFRMLLLYINCLHGNANKSKN